MNKVSSNNGIRQNQTFFHGPHSNLTLFFIGRKILKYLNIIHTFKFHFKVSTNKQNELKSHVT